MNKKSKLTFGKIFERFSYGCGDFGYNIIFCISSVLLYRLCKCKCNGSWNYYDDLQDL